MTGGEGTKRRRRGFTPLTMLVAALLLLSAGAWLGATLITTPREAALQAAPPSPSVIVGKVERRVVEQRIVTRAKAFASQSSNALPASAPEGTSIAILTKPLPKPGTTLAAGDVAAEVSGRPVFVLQGEVPMYRPLIEGSVGADVTQLQRALSTLGHVSSDPNGQFGPSTKAALAALYASKGYPAPANGLPMGEAAFIAQPPALVAQSRGRVGATVEDAALQLSAGAPVVVASVTDAQLNLLHEGDGVELARPGGSAAVPGKIGKVDVEAPPGEQADDQRYVEIVPDKPLGADWIGQGIRAEVVSASSEGAGLAVPVGAVFLNSDGEREVVVVAGEATAPEKLQYRRVAVEVGVIGGGWAEVRAEDGALTEDAAILLSTPTDS